MSQLLYQIALTQIPQVGAVMAKTLVSYCGSAQDVFRASRQALLKIPGVGPLVADNVQRPEPLQLAARELDFVEQHDIQTTFYTDENYPTRLRQNPDCPPLLYFKGSDINLLQARRILAIVGTRQPTEWGKALCEEMVADMQPYGVLIVSGLAYGVDVTAHRKATALNMPNIGILGNGLGNIYPAQHKSVALKMMENGGVVSEFLHHVGPDRENFPMRNRIIAGLCDALLVVETAAAGGSMISATLASQYDRDVFALPGRVRDPKSAGCNLLIKQQKAQLVESATDLAKAMRWEPLGQAKPIQTQLPLDLTPEEVRVLTAIRQQPEIAIDTLAVVTECGTGALAAVILSLEFKGLVRTLPGKRYIHVA